MFERGLDCGGGFGIEGIGEIAAGLEGVGRPGVTTGPGADLRQEEDDPAGSLAELVIDAAVDLHVQVPEEDGVADVLADFRVDLVLGHIGHGSPSGALGLVGEPVERPGAPRFGCQRLDKVVHGIGSEVLLEPAEYDLDGREMVAEVVDAFIERFQLRDLRAGVGPGRIDATWR